MNSHSANQHTFTSDASAHDHSREIAELGLQALAYAEHEFGVGHPVWQSIHDQVACFCQCPESCASAKASGKNAQNLKPRH